MRLKLDLQDCSSREKKIALCLVKTLFLISFCSFFPASLSIAHCDSRKQPLGCVPKKVKKNSKCVSEGNHFRNMNYNTNFVKWFSPSMSLMEAVNVFLNFNWFMYFWSTFFLNISQMMLPNIYSYSVKDN